MNISFVNRQVKIFLWNISFRSDQIDERKFAKAKFILVDHYKSTNRDLFKYEDVIEVHDHHKIDAGDVEAYLPNAVVKNIYRLTGSCATLVAELILDHLENASGLSKLANTREFLHHPYLGVLELLLAPILTDNQKTIFGQEVIDDVDKELDRITLRRIVALLHLKIGKDKTINESMTGRKKQQQQQISNLRQYRKLLKEKVNKVLKRYQSDEKLLRRDLKVEYSRASGIWETRVCVARITMLAQVKCIRFFYISIFQLHIIFYYYQNS